MPSDAQSTKVIQMGLGPIGQRMVQYLAERDGIDLVGAIDIDPDKIGQDVGTLSQAREFGVPVSAAAAEVLGRPADVVILTTSSEFTRLAPQLELCIRSGKSVISTCEELAFPFDTDAALAARIHELAEQHQVAVLATGVNPGFVMDALPIFLTSVCKRVDTVRVERLQDASIRRLPFQQKIGAGLSLAEFEEKRRAGRIRHVGFPESIRMIAHAMGWTLDRIEDEVSPVVAEHEVSSPFIRVAPGDCAGLRQLGRGFMGNAEVVSLELQAYLGHPAPRDTVIIAGEPEIRSSIEGGVDGDIATCAMVLNSLKALGQATPGLHTMADIPLTHWSGR